MKRNLFLFIGLLIMTMASSGCRTAGQGILAQPFNQGFTQPQVGLQNQQSLGGLLGGGLQNQQSVGGLLGGLGGGGGLLGGGGGLLGGGGGLLGGAGLNGGGLPSAEQTQQVLGQFGRNIGSRISNGLINRGVNGLINAAL